jgi:site-specific DNA-methyltransferase (adenine-specific)
VVWEVVKQTAPKGKITAAHVQSTVNVLKEVLATGAIDNGEGVAIPVTEATVDHLKAAVTEETYERTKRQEEYIHQKQEAKEKKREEQFERKNATVIIPDDDRCKLFTGDLESAGAAIEDASVDIIITDPPYPREYLPVYEKLARLGARVLKPGGSMLVMVGQSYLFDIGALMTPHLRYHWTVGYMTPGGQAAQLWQRRVNSFWKPVLWFVNGEYEGDWVGDVAKSDVNDNDKRFHKWGQSESGIADLVNKFTYPGQLILDPFVGGGTTGVVAVNMQRRFIGIDIDPEAIENTRQRLFDSSQENVA